MRIRLLPVSVIAILTSLSFGIARADVFDPTWEPAIAVDTGSIDVSSSGGSAMEHTPRWAPWIGLDEWHVFYAKGGEIYHAVLLPSGWQTPEVLTDTGATARDPKIAFARDRLILVWEDSSLGHPEVWSRMWNGISWSAGVCLTDDATPSKMPVIAGGEYDGYLAWQEGADGGTQVYGRSWDGVWGPPQNVSSSSAYAIEPTITLSLTGYIFAWTDGRHGDSEIYLRELGYEGFGPFVRVTDLPGPCRSPSIHSEECCGDMIMTNAVIAFENNQTGWAETWTACYEWGAIQFVSIVSPNDGRASERPQIHGFTYVVNHDLGGVFPRYMVTWTDAGIPGTKRHSLGWSFECGGPGQTEILSTIGLGASAVAGIEGNPDAGLLAAWIEEREGQRSLIVKRGSILGCEGFAFRGPSAILLTPGGAPSNVMTARNECAGGEPVAGLEMRMSFDPALAGHLTWDASQQHPEIPPQTTGADGVAAFSIRGGGCWPSGHVSLRVNGIEVLAWIGAKSPDVDGDCVVQSDDLAYVASRVGTSDFCADLDGSGTVTQADVAIVQAAVGQICSQLAGVGEVAPESPGCWISPNPSRGDVTIRFAGLGRGPVDVELFDAGGRLVRGWSLVASIGNGQALEWDGRDAASREVPTGVYFVMIRAGEGRVGRSLLITR